MVERLQSRLCGFTKTVYCRKLLMWVIYRLPIRSTRRKLSIIRAEVLQGGHHLEISSASECVIAVGGNHGWESVRYGV